MKYSSEKSVDNLAKIESHRQEVNSRVYNILNKESEMTADIKSIYRAFLALDLLINQLRVSTREIGEQQLFPDEHMNKMAVLLKVGIESLHRGFKNLTEKCDHVQADADAARRAADDTKCAFASALSDMYPGKQGVDAKNTTCNIADLRRRIIYHRLSETADRVTWASQQLSCLNRP